MGPARASEGVSAGAGAGACEGAEAEDCYAALGAERYAGPERVRACYLAAARRLHPDRGGGDAAAFRRAQAAWEVLADPARRAAHDAALRAGEAATRAAAEVDLDELAYDEAAQVFVFACRCSDLIKVPASELERGFDTYECLSCSSKIKVLYQVAEDT
jgi:curved DNA-binding protein CbpA